MRWPWQRRTGLLNAYNIKGMDMTKAIEALVPHLEPWDPKRLRWEGAKLRAEGLIHNIKEEKMPKVKRQQHRGRIDTTQEVRAPEPKRCVACCTTGPHKVDECIRQVRKQQQDWVRSVLNGCSVNENLSKDAEVMANKVGRLALWAMVVGATGAVTGVLALIWAMGALLS